MSSIFTYLSITQIYVIARPSLHSLPFLYQIRKCALLFIVFTSVSMVTAVAQRQMQLQNMVFIPGGEMQNEAGTTTIFKPFYISHQITNKEFKVFWNYAKSNPKAELFWAELQDASAPKASMVKSIVYADLLKNPPVATNWPVSNYFDAPEFENSPVIGVSVELANFYCIWKTTFTNNNLAENEHETLLPYNLPSSLQLLYAKKCKPEIFTDNELGFRIYTLE